MNKEELIAEIKRKIEDERELYGEYYTGRVAAFEYILSILKDDAE